MATAVEAGPPAGAGPTVAATGEAILAVLRQDDPAAAARLARPRAEAGEADAQFVLGFLSDVGAGARLDQKAAPVWLEKAAAQGHVVAQRYLAWRCETGFGAEKPDPAAARRWRALSATEPALDAGLSRWLEVRAGVCAPKFPRVFFWMMDRAGTGDVVAQANLAHAYLENTWTKADTSQHLYWLEKAAGQRDIPSLELLATYYEFGLFVTTDTGRAFALRRTAAEAGSADSQYYLGQHYEQGDGVAADAVEAVKWYRLAAAQDHRAALLRLVSVLRDGRPGVAPDFAEALRLCRRGVELGDAEAITNLADLHNRGEGVPRDYPKSAELYRQAADRGFVRAMTMLGWIHLKGELGQPDYAEARRWFEQAAAKDDARAMRELGLLYENGLGVAKDPAKAFEWIERAAREGEGWSQNHVGWMLREGIGIERDDEEAIEWFRLAARNGEPMSEVNLGYHYLHGLAVPRDRRQAFDHLVAAARQSEDAWGRSLLWQAVTGASGTEREELRSALRTISEDPALLDATGDLPAICLALLETAPDVAGDRNAASALLQRLVGKPRPLWFAALAHHAFWGKFVPFDPARARGWARELAATDPKASARLLAEIDGIAAPTAEGRAAAQAELARLADAGDAAAARILADRLADGLGCEADWPRALRYYGIAFAGANDAAIWIKEMKRRHESVVVPPAPEALAKLRAAAEHDQGSDAEPRVIFSCPPVFPPELRTMGVEGEAMIRFVVDPDGQPVEIRAVSSTHPLFAIAAEAAIRRWRFAPARKHGRPFAKTVEQPLRFNLNDWPSASTSKP